jgi:heme/copper-type cytochrome/quinol oxidase subunit 2
VGRTIIGPPTTCSRIPILPGLALLLLFAGCDTQPPARVDVVNVRLVAHDRSWHASYVVADATNRSAEVPTGREVHVPLGAGVHLMLASPDFISAFTVSDLDLRHFAAPDLPSQVTFFADHVGRYELRGDELCGRPHTDRARGWLVVEPPTAFQDWVRKRTREARR